ncbi:MAG: hypothetical protein L7S55_00010, partial [Luminiphilus sp.]|nr:hypothetical protein [Luminiphilus sp.]
MHEDRCIPVDQCVPDNDSRHDRRAAVGSACGVDNTVYELGRVPSSAGYEKGDFYAHSDGQDACVAEPSAQGNLGKRRFGGCPGGLADRRLRAYGAPGGEFKAETPRGFESKAETPHPYPPSESPDLSLTELQVLPSGEESGGNTQKPEEQGAGKSVQYAAIAQSMQDASCECSSSATSDYLEGKRDLSGRAANEAGGPDGPGSLAYRTWPSSHSLKTGVGHCPDSTEGSGVKRS